MNDLRRITRFLSPYKMGVVIATVFLGFVVVADLYIPRLIQTIIDEGVVKRDMNIVLTTSLLMIGVSVLEATLSIANTLYSVKVSRGFEADLREAIFKKVQTFSFGNLDDLNTGQLLTRLTS
ncbi:ABC transporter ATP-binding protein, partial [Candidatus Bathyarchaeota archaeon]